MIKVTIVNESTITKLNPNVDEQIGEYKVYSPKLDCDLSIIEYNVYGERTFYVSEPNNKDYECYYDLDDICIMYGCNSEDFINDYVKDESRKKRLINMIKVFESKKKTESFDMTGYKYKTNRDGYDLYSKMVNSKGKWIAVKDGQDPIEISYDQARGFEPIDSVDNKIQKKVKNALTKKESTDHEFTYKELDSKTVMDFDGFFTDYTLYEIHDGPDTSYACILGDKEMYTPDDSEPDFETESRDEALEWFDNYNGAEDEFDDEDY